MHAVLIPARNEEGTLAGVIDDLQAVIRGLTLEVHFIVIDDGSTDRTFERAAAAGASVVRVDKPSGLANAFQCGVDEAIRLGADYIIHVDADGQYAAEDLPALLALAAPGRLVVGDRLHVPPPGMSEVRYLWNKNLSQLVGSLAGTPIADGQSGFRIFGRELAARFRIKSSFTYTQEQIVRASHAGFEIVQPPITFRPRTQGASRLVRSPINYLAQVFRDLDLVANELDIDVEHLRMLPSRE